ncbi:BCLAF1 and THRAP3 family member 3 isoform X1 [Trichomycterus rosablanca]|uniref:BCLAF1 and THRAP3 family member 3 isoform X1 n=1 Tax=Trichomycterus rosablanca TaxID=2290929 RepID=UPI002F35C07A
MSRPRSRTPLHSRNSNQNGRRRDGFYGGLYQANPWRGQELVNEAESAENWENSYSRKEDQVDHWAKFIEAIGQAGKGKPSPMTRYLEEKSSRSPRRSHRERSSFSEAVNYEAETHDGNHSMGRRRNDHDVHSHRHYSRGASPRMEHGYQNEEHEPRHQHERGSYMARSQKSNYREDHLHHKGFRHSDPQEEFGGSHKGFGPRGAPVIVEHDHGISTHYGRNRDASRNRDATKSMSRDPIMSQDHPRNRDSIMARKHPRSQDKVINPKHSWSRDPQTRSGSVMTNREYSVSTHSVMNREHSRSRDPPRRGGNHQKNSEPRSGRGPPRRHDLIRNKDGHGGFADYHFREEEQSHASSAGWEPPMSQHREQPRMKSHPRDSHGRKATDFNTDVDLRMGEKMGMGWKQEIQAGQHRGDMQKQGKTSRFQPRNCKTPGAREDFSRHETLKIQVDMSRPVGQSSHLGYSSDRQLSLDLVNVGRQRLDFLPMLEHSGSYRETAMHTGTFAQEIISLVHHVKENYFQGQGVPLNERFSDQQLYTLVDEEQFANAEELEDTGPIINRPFFSRSSDTQVFCKVGPLQKRLQPPGPGDLRFDLEKKRLQKLEGVKITIAGNSRIPPQQPQENKPAYADVEYRPDSLSDLGWSKLEHQRTDQWDGPPAKRFAPNFNARRNSDRLGTRSGPRGRRNPNIGTRW